MKVKHKDVRVRISRRILWVGSQAYPLSQAVRVHPDELKLRRGPILMNFGRRSGATIALAALGLGGMACIGRSVPIAVWVAYWLVAGGLLAFHVTTLVRLLRLPKMYVLRVSMAGSEQATVVSTNKRQIDDLTMEVADAIDNPAAEFEIRVDNIEFIHGDRVDGDKVLGDKTIFEGSS